MKDALLSDDKPGQLIVVQIPAAVDRIVQIIGEDACGSSGRLVWVHRFLMAVVWLGLFGSGLAAIFDVARLATCDSRSLKGSVSVDVISLLVLSAGMATLRSLRAFARTHIRGGRLEVPVPTVAGAWAGAEKADDPEEAIPRRPSVPAVRLETGLAPRGTLRQVYALLGAQLVVSAMNAVVAPQLAQAADSMRNADAPSSGWCGSGQASPGLSLAYCLVYIAYFALFTGAAIVAVALLLVLSAAVRPSLHLPAQHLALPAAGEPDRAAAQRVWSAFAAASAVADAISAAFSPVLSACAVLFAVCNANNLFFLWAVAFGGETHGSSLTAAVYLNALFSLGLSAYALAILQAIDRAANPAYLDRLACGAAPLSPASRAALSALALQRPIALRVAGVPVTSALCARAFLGAVAVAGPPAAKLLLRGSSA